jgi:hypothetical protein
MRISYIVLVFTVAFGAGCQSMGFKDKNYHPQIDPANFQSKVDNSYFPLVPGTVLMYTERGGGETSENEITVMNDTKTIMGVKCVIVHDVVRKNGRVAEDTYDWYAQDKSGAVWYFGEDTKEISPGGRVSTAGSWEAGVNGQPGIMMPAQPRPGDPYRQEYSPNNAEDMGQVVAINETVSVPAGKYTGCVKTKDWSLLEAGHENKWYAPGIGVVRAQSSGGDTEELTSITKP